MAIKRASVPVSWVVEQLPAMAAQGGPHGQYTCPRSAPAPGIPPPNRNRRGTALKVLMYDDQGFWLCHKRLSQGRFPWWPAAAAGSARRLAAHQLLVLLAAGNPTRTGTIPDWRPVGPSV